MEELNLRKVVSLVFIVGIAVVFTLQFGPGSTGFSGGNNPQAAAPGAAAMVNGKEIPLRDFNRAYSIQIANLRNQGRPIPEAMARQFLVPQVMDRLVNIELLAQEAEKHGITPSDEELRKVIHQRADFQTNGQFDYERYKRMLRDYYRKTLPEYEKDLRREMAAIKLVELVRNAAIVSDDEVRVRYEKDANQTKLVFARFLPTMYADKVPAPTPQQLEEYRKAHEKEISEYYETNRIIYKQPERAKARQILIKVAEGATAEQKDAAKARAAALRKDVTEGGKDFVAVAKESSEDPGTKGSGGDLGWVERKSLEPAVADAVFSLEANAVSEPIESKLGYHVVKVEQKNPGADKKLEDVAGEIATSLYKKDQAKVLAKAEAEKALAAVKGGQTLQQLFPAGADGPALQRFETEAKPEAVETGSVSAGSASVHPNLGPTPELIAAAFTAQGPQVLDQAFPAGEGFVIAQVTERKKPSPEDFTKQKDELREQARQAKQIELEQSYLKTLREAGKVTTNTEAIESVVGAS
jgi:peptidyl-prolyl cis-trans isomerase D